MRFYWGDVGLKTFAAFSNGEFIENPRFFRKDEKALVKAQRNLSRQKRGSRERKKARKVVSGIHERIRNRRHDFCHQNARRIVNRFGMIAVEKLSVKNMLGNHCLAKSMADAAWSQFRCILTSKAESAGREILAVNPAYTSQDCSGCGYRPDGLEGRTKKKLSDRWHLCPRFYWGDVRTLRRPRHQRRRQHSGIGTTMPRYRGSVEASPFMGLELSHASALAGRQV